ncbi:MAG: SDR family oxidoreductase [Candidatus Omnitrophica bacterium]|nr:SDR family oxidoreductase [Candidatus Omnitrophota bacterium]
MREKKTILLTGATGLVGSYLLKELLNAGQRVFVLSRATGDKTAESRVEQVVNFWDKDTLKNNRENLKVFNSDITRQNLGLSSREYKDIQQQTNIIYHSAAITEFNWPLEEIRKINVEGTRNILELAKGAKNIERINHLSTAYVCGNYNGVFSENDLDKGQSFNTTYEQSKFEAEKLVVEYRKKGLWIDIFRPPIIVGETQTGKTIKFQGFYQLLYMCRLEIFDVLPGKDIEVNMVAVDALARSIILISDKSSEKNKTYNTFKNKTVKVEDVIDLYSRITGKKKPNLVNIREFDTKQLTPIQRRLLQFNIFAFPANAKLDSYKTNEYLASLGFIYPDLDKIFLTHLIEFTERK